MQMVNDERVKDFARRLVDWLEDNLDRNWTEQFPVGSAEWVAFQKDWDRRLYDGGWAGVFWPAEFGGMDVGPGERALYAQVMAQAGAPEGFGKIGKRLLAPALMSHGTVEQRERFLGPILRGDEFWCQGFSEPAAGSDLASLKTRAVRDGENYVINGQKIWTSHAACCDWMFLLARTDASGQRQRGISMFLLPVDAPGLHIRPIAQINGGHDFNETFLDDVVVSSDMRVGDENQGWTVAKSLLSHERGLEMAFAALATSRSALDRLIRAAAVSGRRDLDMEIGLLEARCLGTEANAMRLAETQLQAGDPTDVSSILRLQSTSTYQDAAEAALLSAPTDWSAATGSSWHRLVTDYLTSRGATIAGGASEIQLNIIAKRLLGMG